MIPHFDNVSTYHRLTEDIPQKGGSSVEEIFARFAVEVLVALAVLALRQLVRRLAPSTARYEASIA
jgi:hypothetical protein